LNFDFEDSVPQSQKAYARTLVAHAIQQGLKGGADITLRINCSYPEADVPAAVLPGLTQINFPKAETAEQMRHLDRLITEAERVRGIRPGAIRIGANIETTLGVASSYEIASASPRIDTFAGGTGYDMSMDMGVEMFVGFDQFVYNRGEGALVAKALSLEYTGGVYLPDTTGDVGNTELTRQQAEAKRKAGLRAGSGLHPNTVEPQNVGLTPTPEEVQEAHRIVAYFAELDERGEVEGELDGRIIDKYEAARATELIEWAELCAQKDAHKARAQARTRALEAQEQSNT
jgi:citrate lyase subunit beta/citryl-CoA lyase